jgi:hypothetical protein
MSVMGDLAMLMPLICGLDAENINAAPHAIPFGIDPSISMDCELAPINYYQANKSLVHVIGYPHPCHRIRYRQ